MTAPIQNPLGTDGFEFIEFCSPDVKKMQHQFEEMGFSEVAKHKSKQALLLRQGKINFIINDEPNTHATKFAKVHGASACAMGFRVKDADKAFKKAVERGAKPYHNKSESRVAEVPAIYGIGGSLIYFVDKYDGKNIYDDDFEFNKRQEKYPPGFGLTHIDHLTHNVKRGEMDTWAKFYENLFNFREIRYFDIKGKKTGLISRAMTSPCGKIRIPINEATDEKSQIQEFIDDFKGEGIQHVALGTENIYETVETMRQHGIKFLKTPNTYFEMLDERIPWHKEDLNRLQANQILMDGEKNPDKGLLLQIFTENMLGPVFFEIIQRKGNEGFGEGNFQALFDAIERDQMRRGKL